MQGSKPSLLLWQVDSLPLSYLGRLFQKKLYHFTFSPAVYEISDFFISSQTIAICLLDYSHSLGEWYLIVGLIFNYLITNDVEHFFMYLLAICISSLGKYLFRFLAHL